MCCVGHLQALPSCAPSSHLFKKLTHPPPGTPPQTQPLPCSSLNSAAHQSSQLLSAMSSSLFLHSLKPQTWPQSLWCPRPPTELEQHSSDPRLPCGLRPHPDKPSSVQASVLHTQLCGYCPLTPGCRISLPPPIPTLHPQSEVTYTAL